MKKIILWTYILQMILFISCARDTEITPLESEPEIAPIEVVIQKIKENSPEVEKYFLSRFFYSIPLIQQPVNSKLVHMDRGGEGLLAQR
jgi:hypothetical protein